MKFLIIRSILAGLMALPVACATYSRQYYDSGYDYSPGQYNSSYGYSPGQYNSGYGYGVVERNYYNTYSYPTPVYRTEEYHHHHDGRDDRYPDRRYQDNRHYSTSPGTTYRRSVPQRHEANDHYNWNAGTAKPYDNRQSEWDRQRHADRNEGRQGRPDDPNAHGQWQRQQNWDRQEARRQNRVLEEHSSNRDGARWQNRGGASPAQQNSQEGQQGHRGRRQRNQEGNQSGQ
ncbi:MAG: hypothetical protein ACR65R_19700 [Methylomicrobium sp.]